MICLVTFNSTFVEIVVTGIWALSRPEVLQRDEQVAEWIKITERILSQSAKETPKGRGQPEGGVADLVGARSKSPRDGRFEKDRRRGQEVG
jgi:hypothetical protein